MSTLCKYLQGSSPAGRYTQRGRTWSFRIWPFAYFGLFVNRVEDPSMSRLAKAQRATLVLAHAANDEGVSNKHGARDITLVMLVLDGSPRCGEPAVARDCLFVSFATAYVLGRPRKGAGRSRGRSHIMCCPYPLGDCRNSHVLNIPRLGGVIILWLTSQLLRQPPRGESYINMVMRDGTLCTVLRCKDAACELLATAAPLQWAGIYD